MSRSTVLVRLLAAVVLGLVLVPSLSDASPPPMARAQHAGADYHEPDNGACYDMTWEQGLGNSTTPPPVACDGRHTLMTIAVVRIPKRIRWSSDDLADSYGARCSDALYAALGGNPKAAAMSAYDYWYFFPTKAERRMGARWVRCDVGKLHGVADMDPLPASLDLGPLPLSQRDARCLVGKKLFMTSCDHRHQWRAKEIFQLHSRAQTEAEYQQQGQRCGRLLGTRRWLFDGPSLGEWLAGNRFMVCFKPD